MITNYTTGITGKNYNHLPFRTNDNKIKPVQTATLNKSETMADKTIACGALSVIAGIGLAVIFRNNLVKTISNIKNFIGKRNKTIAREIPLSIVSYNAGPKFDIRKGKTAISDGWNTYINNIEKRIHSHSNYNKIFKENRETLDKFEEVANERINARLINVA